MIKAEETDREPGYRGRIEMLEEFRQKALVDEHVSNLDQKLQSTKESMGKHFKFPGDS